ncbi:hypothetical protein AB0D10_31015 [Kitasatospora sp. NPDC048545]
MDSEKRTVWVNRTKDEVKNSPEYVREQHTDDPDYQRAIGSYYGGIY